MNQQNIQWTKIQVRQTIGALGIFLSVLILQIFAAVITLALSKVTGITPNSPNYVMFVSMVVHFCHNFLRSCAYFLQRLFTN